MELFSAEAQSIQRQITAWVGSPDYELETTFGGGSVDSTTFISVAKRLRAKGYTNLPQEDRLTITTPEHVRYTIASLAVIQQYCRDDTIAGKPFAAMIKDRATEEGHVDLDEYGVRVKTRREILLANDDAAIKDQLKVWGQQRKAFRMIRRWSFGGDAQGIRIDMSIVRSTKKDSRGDFRWQRKFRDQDVLASAPSYEIEVELLHQEGDTVESATKRLVKGIGEVLRGIQKHSLLIRKSMKDKVLSGYKILVGTDLFRGPAPITLQKKNFVPLAEREKAVPNLRDGYNVTDKADGLRCLAYCDARGELFLIDMGMNVYRTGLEQPECRLSLLDGEWVTQTLRGEAIQQYLAFDIFFTVDKKSVSKLPFQATEAVKEGRHAALKNWLSLWNKSPGPKVMPGVTPKTQLQVSGKEFFFGRAGDESIFRAASQVLTAARPYYTDGLIFTPNTLPLTDKPAGTFFEQFKWKPPQENTIDFLVSTEKVPESKTTDKVTRGIKPGSNETVNYKTLRLMVGSRNENARDIILNKRTLPPKERGWQGKKDNYKPVVFTPKEFPDPMASICNLEIHTDPDTGEEYVQTEDSNEPIQDMTIVEMSYDISKPAGWRWTPLVVRMDKTERFQAGKVGRTLNSDMTAEDVWNSIYDPITETMIKTGAQTMSEKEQAAIAAISTTDVVPKKYYAPDDSVDDAVIRGMRNFHNVWIKEKILFRAALAGGGKTLIDTSCGRGADMHKWRRAGAAFVLGVDLARDNIMNTKDGAYARYMGVMQEDPQAPPMVFAIADSSKALADGSAGATDEEKDILRSVLGRVKPVGPVAPYIEEFAAGRLRAGADSMCSMFALHYFFENEVMWNGFIKNVADCLKVGGYFIGCCFDGQKVFELLRGVPKGGSKSGTEKGGLVWSITKEYDEDEMPEGDAFGLAIDVVFATIGKHREYLIPFPALVEKMAAVGCELLTGDETKALGLDNSSETFDASWTKASKNKGQYAMSDTVKQFSFLNRWFVFKKKRQEDMAVAAAAAVAVANVANAGPNAGPKNKKNKNNAANAVNDANAGPNAANVNAAGPSATANLAKPAVKSRANNRKSNATAALSEADKNAIVSSEQVAAATGVPLAIRTLPVAPGEAAPEAPRYALGEVFLFYVDAALKDSLGLKDAGAARWLAPSAPFPIEDTVDKTIIYPSLEHAIAGMQMRSSDKPELAAALFGREGTIHQKFLNERLVESAGGTKPISEQRDYELLKAESSEVKDALRPASLKRYSATLDPAKWSTERDTVLREAIKQRWTRDARFRKIVEAVREKGKVLLFYVPGAGMSNLGGVRRADGHIDGENRLGRLIMEVAGFPGYAS
jgi:hypothetical protein